MLQHPETTEPAPGPLACVAETRIGPSGVFGETRTEPLPFVSERSHRACGVSWPEVASDLRLYSQPDPIGLHQGGSYQGLNLLYGYADNRPNVLTDPLGLYVPTKGCTPEEHTRIQKAGQKAEAAATTCLPCGEDPFQWALRIRHTVWHCDHRGSDSFCGMHGRPRPDYPFYDDTGRDITLGPGGLSGSKFCGCLQATMLHEVAHYFNYTHKAPKDAYGIEKPCFSCAGERPE